MSNLFTWQVHGDGKTLKPGEVVEPDERLTWPRTAEIGAQHVIAMFGATFLVPILTGFDPSTTLFFTAMSTALFLLINRTCCRAIWARPSVSSRRSPPWSAPTRASLSRPSASWSPASCWP